MTTATEAVANYGQAWGEPDEAQRRKLLDAAWADDGVYCDPTGTAAGREALVQHIGGFQQAMAAHRIEMTSGIDEHDGFARFAWKVVGPEGNDVMEGIDFVTFDDDSRIKLLVGFFGPFPEVS